MIRAILILILCIMVLISNLSCTKWETKAPKKPFIIYKKYPSQYAKDSMIIYKAYCANEVIIEFWEYKSKYNIGDTIK